MTIRSGKLGMRFDITEIAAVDSLFKSLPISIERIIQLANGTTDGDYIDTVFYDEQAATASPVTYDLLGSLTSSLTGSTISFVDIAGIFIWNTNALASAAYLTVGAGSNPLLAMVATGDVNYIRAQGHLWWHNPYGFAPVASTGDVLTITPSASCAWTILMYGRSA